ncbi:MAG: acetyl-CoA carboxylase biotin carboxyl carrier protein subunit [Alphaproteobacteria bacterium]|nr:acetyl-CoA carboxylase biotin carboxyl carrier protein subunit [Alphaproteobacteria bacterium]
MSQIKVRSEISGRVSAIETSVGARVKKDDALVILESMKMEIPLVAPVGGTVTKILVEVGDSVAEGQEIAAIEA